MFSCKLQTGTDPLAAIDPSLYSVGYLFLLLVPSFFTPCTLADCRWPKRNYRLSAPTIDLEEGQLLFNFIVNFVQVFDPFQLRLVPDQGSSLRPPPICTSTHNFHDLVLFLARSIRVLAGQQVSRFGSYCVIQQLTMPGTWQPEIALAPLSSLITRYCPPGVLSAMHPILLVVS